MNPAQSPNATSLDRFLGFLASRWLWIVLIIVTIAALWYSVHDLSQYSGVDLRNRVVGARALLGSLDPYTIAWRPGLPLELADASQRYPGVTRVTAAPPLLLFYMPFGELPYRSQQIIWWALQWAALAITIGVLARSFQTESDRNIFVLIAVVCFVGSWFWRLHVERGQYYIFSTMLVSLDLARLRGKDTSAKSLGIPSGIAIAIKPTNVILLPMLWFLGERRAALTAALAAALMVGVSCYPSGPGIWTSYFSGIQDYVRSEISSDYVNSHFGPVQATAPKIIEGTDFERLPMKMGVDGYSITPGDILYMFGSSWTAFYLSQVALIALFVIGPLSIWWLRRRGTVPRDYSLLAIALVLAAVEFTRPLRWEYVDVTFLPILAFLVTTLPRSWTFVLLTVLTCMFYVAPFESKWVVRARHFLTLTLAGAIVTRGATSGLREDKISKGSLTPIS